MKIGKDLKDHPVQPSAHPTMPTDRVPQMGVGDAELGTEEKHSALAIRHLLDASTKGCVELSNSNSQFVVDGPWSKESAASGREVKTKS